MAIVNLNLKNAQNIGDAVCAPCQYFPLGEHLDLSDDIPELTNNDTIIFGGGCIAVRAGLYQTKAKKILWGAGYSERGGINDKPFHVNKGFALYGSRDIGGGDWVGCPSCMSPLFDNIPEPVQDVVTYGHAEFDPMELNNDCMDFEKVLRYLSKGETIITSSYHGMYWGYLLGRRVIVRPFGSKFYKLPWGISTDKGIIYKQALSEARESNLNFYEKVKKII